MFAIASALLSYLLSLFRPKHQLALEVLALRHQIMVLKRQTPRPKLRRSDRCLWIMLRKVWPGWKAPLMIFQPETVIGWQRAGFRRFWRWKSRSRLGRPGKDPALIQLIRRMWTVNPTWGSPRIRDELAKLGLEASTATIRKYRPQVPTPTITKLANLSPEPRVYMAKSSSSGQRELNQAMTIGLPAIVCEVGLRRC